MNLHTLLHYSMLCGKRLSIVFLKEQSEKTGSR